MKVSDVVVWSLGFSDDRFLVLYVGEGYSLLWALREKYVLNITEQEYFEYELAQKT